MENSPSAQGIEASRSRQRPALNIGALLSSSRVYIIEHFMVMAALVVSIIAAVSLFNAVIDHFMSESSSGSSFGVAVQIEQLVLYISMALVALPLFSLFYIRSRKTERAHPSVLRSRARRRMSYVFVAVAFVFVLGYLIGFSYTTTLKLVSVDTGAASESWLHTSLKQFFAIFYIGLAGLFVSRLTPGIDEEVSHEK